VRDAACPISTGGGGGGGRGASNPQGRGAQAHATASRGLAAAGEGALRVPLVRGARDAARARWLRYRVAHPEWSERVGAGGAALLAYPPRPPPESGGSAPGLRAPNSPRPPKRG
jgi:hypothetical protein